MELSAQDLAIAAAVYARAAKQNHKARCVMMAAIAFAAERDNAVMRSAEVERHFKMTPRTNGVRRLMPTPPQQQQANADHPFVSVRVTKRFSLWVLLTTPADRDGYALKPLIWEGGGEYQHVVLSDGREGFIKTTNAMLRNLRAFSAS